MTTRREECPNQASIWNLIRLTVTATRYGVDCHPYCRSIAGLIVLVFDFYGPYYPPFFDGVCTIPLAVPCSSRTSESSLCLTLVTGNPSYKSEQHTLA